MEFSSSKEKNIKQNGQETLSNPQTQEIWAQSLVTDGTSKSKITKNIKFLKNSIKRNTIFT